MKIHELNFNFIIQSSFGFPNSNLKFELKKNETLHFITFYIAAKCSKNAQTSFGKYFVENGGDKAI